MRVLVIGCGRVGSALATGLVAEQHDVAVIDRNPKARRLLPTAFSGRFIVGNGYNRAALEEAGVEHADALIAVTSGDNSNIVSARTAKEVYRVPTVIARIYDPRRADIYRDLGIPTVASVRWTVTRVQQLLLHRDLTTEHSFGNGEIQLVTSHLPAYLVNRPFTELEVDGAIRVVEVTRGGRSFIPVEGTAIEAADLVTFTVATSALGRLRTFVDRELGT
jgi:trk/ktr system potassium uptake protein